MSDKPAGREFSDTAKERIEWLFSRYPTKVAALLPVIRLAEEEFGIVDGPAVQCVARTIGISPGYVYGVLSFYTHYKRPGDGRFVVQVCSTLPCALRGSQEIVRRLQERLGVKPGETTSDGVFTLKKVECLGSCDTAPVLQVNSDDYHEQLTAEVVDGLIDELRAMASDMATSS